MSGGQERFRLRYPLWTGVGAALFAGLIFYIGAGDSLYFRVVSALIGLGLLVFAIWALRSDFTRIEVILSDHAITTTAPLRGPVRIDFGSTERVEVRPVGPHRELHVHAPGQHISVSDLAFPDSATFDQIVDTVAERVSAHGGPTLTVVPRSRFDGSFVA